jgi:hypothetical protein
MPVAPVGRAVGRTLIIEMLVQLGVENALGKRLLQIVERPSLTKTSFGSRPESSRSSSSFLVAI